MKLAIREAEKAIEHKDIPVGAIIIKENRIIARTHNQVELLKDPTAHAEMLAITQAANTLQEKRLTECALYVTLEPCAMCVGAIVLARIKNLFYAAHDPKLGACGSRFDNISSHGLNHYVNVSSGIESEKAEKLLKHFFTAMRNKDKK